MAIAFVRAVCIVNALFSTSGAHDGQGLLKLDALHEVDLPTDASSEDTAEEEEAAAEKNALAQGATLTQLTQEKSCNDTARADEKAAVEKGSLAPAKHALGASQAMHKENMNASLNFPLVAAFKLVMKLKSMAGQLRKMLGNQYVTIIQMDPETFSPAQEVQSSMSFPPGTFADARYDPMNDLPRGSELPNALEAEERVWGTGMGPAGRVITDKTEGWETAERGVKVPFGTAKIIRVQDFAVLRVMKAVDVFNDLQSQFDGSHASPVELLCEKSRNLAGGGLYVYVGSRPDCADSFLDISGFQWGEKVSGATFFTSQFCGALPVESQPECIAYLGCAVNEVENHEALTRNAVLVNNHVNIPASSSCRLTAEAVNEVDAP